MTKKRQSKPMPRQYPIVHETFDGEDADPVRGMLHLRREPSCVNWLSVDRYRITVEKIEEPNEVILARMVTLWRTKQRNMHHTTAFRTRAMELGLTREEADKMFDFHTHGIDHGKDKS